MNEEPGMYRQQLQDSITTWVIVQISHIYYWKSMHSITKMVLLRVVESILPPAIVLEAGGCPQCHQNQLSHPPHPSALLYRCPLVPTPIR
jgi:hypothetical protein